MIFIYLFIIIIIIESTLEAKTIHGGSHTFIQLQSINLVIKLFNRSNFFGKLFHLLQTIQKSVGTYLFLQVVLKCYSRQNE